VVEIEPCLVQEAFSMTVLVGHVLDELMVFVQRGIMFAHGQVRVVHDVAELQGHVVSKLHPRSCRESEIVVVIPVLASVFHAVGGRVDGVEVDVIFLLPVGKPAVFDEGVVFSHFISQADRESFPPLFRDDVDHSSHCLSSV
jgi:hypothetical protein